MNICLRLLFAKGSEISRSWSKKAFVKLCTIILEALCGTMFFAKRLEEPQSCAKFL